MIDEKKEAYCDFLIYGTTDKELIKWHKKNNTMKKESLKQMLQRGCWGERYDRYAYIFDETSHKIAQYEWSYFVKVRNEYYKEKRGY